MGFVTGRMSSHGSRGRGGLLGKRGGESPSVSRAGAGALGLSRPAEGRLRWELIALYKYITGKYWSGRGAL